MASLQVADVHRVATGQWQHILAGLGVDESCLRNRHQPCPVCGGKDRFRWDDKGGRGTWICSKCGAGDGFKLLQAVHGWGFRDALLAVASFLGIESSAPRPAAPRAPMAQVRTEPATVTRRVLDLLRTCTAPEMVAGVVDYLRGRRVWPLPARCSLKAHVGYDYIRPLQGKAFENLGRFACLVAPVVDVEGELVTAHVTYTENGRKFARVMGEGEALPARKILSPLTGRRGCAVRLAPIAEVLGVAEGIETALSAMRIHDMPVWSCLNTRLLAKFVPPPGVRHVVVFADNDLAGMKAAWELRDELEGRCTVELRAPADRYGDWNDCAMGSPR